MTARKQTNTLPGMKLHTLLSFALALAPLCTNAQDTPSPANIPTHTGQYEIHPDFSLTLVADDSLVHDPVDLQFDETGRAFVVEMGGYPFASDDPEEYPGKIVILEDTNRDNVFDTRTVFADHLQYANSILPHRGGILVAAPPDILFLQDTNGDQRADLRKTLVSGFSVGNAQHNVNGLIHGLDNWIYAGNGGNSGTLFWPDHPNQTTPVRNRDIKFNFETRQIEFLGPTTTGFSVAIDNWGRVFTTHNLKHVNHLPIPYRYTELNPYLTPPSNPDISDHKTGELDRGYSIGKQESRLNHPEQSGYFSCSCGITFYGGGAFPKEFDNALFVADSVLNIIHHDQLQPDGPVFRASRTRNKVEFLATSDRHSRPVNLRVGPDGALYVVDMYRAVIEHPEWIPDELEKDMDLFAGSDQGRIYRVTPKTGLPKADPRFDRDNLPAVVSYLEHPNRWFRDTAQRLLVWWQDPRSIPLLQNLATHSTSPLARVHALWTLHALINPESGQPTLGALTDSLLTRALQDPHPGVRENALQIAERSLATCPALLQQTLLLANDPDPRVRMQTALSLGLLLNSSGQPASPPLLQALMTILQHDLQQTWSRHAVILALSHDATPLLQKVLTSPTPGNPPARNQLIADLATLVGTQSNPTNVTQTLHFVTASSTTATSDQLAILQGLQQGLANNRSFTLSTPQQQTAQASLNAMARLIPKDSPTHLTALLKIAQQLQLNLQLDTSTISTKSPEAILNPQLPLEERLAHLNLLATASSDLADREDLLWELLQFHYPQELQIAALRQLLNPTDTRITATLIQRWSQLSRACRSLASDALIYRSTNHDLLLTALEDQTLPMGQLNLDLERRRRLLRSSDPAIRQRAEQLFSDAGVVTRSEVIKTLQPATRLTGNPEAGKTHYLNLCSQCHTIASTGHAVGPDLTEIFRKGPESLLSDVFDPNAAVNTEYLGITIDTQNDEVYTGILLAETEALLTLKEAGGREITLPRTNIANLISTGLSLMPEGLESGLSLQDVADLLAFLQQSR
jgi:putative membrane-bound dehydrogenase-like protein